MNTKLLNFIIFDRHTKFVNDYYFTSLINL